MKTSKAPESNTTTTFDPQHTIAQVKQIVLDPVGFYKHLPVSKKWEAPLIFIALMGVLTGIVSVVYTFGMKAAAFSLLIMMPIMAVIGSFVGAAILFVIWHLMGSKQDYKRAYDCVAYSFVIMPAVALISFLPYLPGAIQTVWSCFLLYVASITVHQIKEQTAKMVFGIFAILGLLSGVSAEYKARSLTNFFEDQAEIFKDTDLEKVSQQLEAFEEQLEGFKDLAEEADIEE